MTRTEEPRETIRRRDDPSAGVTFGDRSGLRHFLARKEEGTP